MRILPLVLLTTLALSGLAVACAPPAEPTDDTGPAAGAPTPETPEADATPTAGGATVGKRSAAQAIGTPTAEEAARRMDAPADAPAVVAARERFAEELDVAREAVEVLSVEAVEWNNSGLGCEDPSQMYLQVITPGYRVQVATDDKAAVYHTDRGSKTPTVVRCKPIQERATSSGLRELNSAIQLASEDLRERLGSGVAFDLVSHGPAPVSTLTCEDVTVDVAPDSSVAASGAAPEKSAAADAVPLVFEMQFQTDEGKHVYRAQGTKILYCGLKRGYAIE